MQLNGLNINSCPVFVCVDMRQWYMIIINHLTCRAFKIMLRPSEFRRVARSLPPVTLFSTWIINSALLPPLWAFKQSYFSSTWSTLYSLVIFENDVLFCKTDLVICHLKSWKLFCRRMKARDWSLSIGVGELWKLRGQSIFQILDRRLPTAAYFIKTDAYSE
jgi:hypothetical protein